MIIPANVLVDRAHAASKGYASGRLIVYDNTAEILEANPEEPENPEEKIKEITQEMEKELKARLEEGLTQDVYQTLEIELMTVQGSILQFKEKYIRQGKIAEDASTYEYLKALYKETCDIEQTKGINALLLDIMARYADIPKIDLDHIQEGDIIVIKHISIGDACSLIEKGIGGVITEEGRNAHIAAVCAEYGLPCLTECHFQDETKELGHLPNETYVVINGFHGQILINPDPKARSLIKEAKQKYDEHKDKLKTEGLKPLQTNDGQNFKIYANVNDLNFKNVLDINCNGIGLVRSEVFHKRFPGHTELSKAFKNASTAILRQDRSITIRLLDVNNSDKPAQEVLTEEELRHAKGVGELFGAAFLVANKPILDEELRGYIEASEAGELNIMIPFVKNPEEVKFIRERLNKKFTDVQQDINAPHIFCTPKLEIMVETKALIDDEEKLEETIKLSDGISIGSSDLMHEYAGTDRSIGGDHKTEYDQGFIKKLKLIADLAHKHNKPIRICGELASRTEYLPILVGLGIENVAAPDKIPEIRARIRHLNGEDCEKLVQSIISEEKNKEKIEALLKEFNEPHQQYKWQPDEYELSKLAA